jgi:glutamyl-tRNA synthetase
MNNSSSLANLIFPDVDNTIQDVGRVFENRAKMDSVLVTRYAPSPTGELHVGAIFLALINKMLANQSGGIYILRIDDTDVNRCIENATENIVKVLANSDILADEGPYQYKPNFQEKGRYGPYVQTLRKEYYRTFAKHLVESGRAYPCFMTSDELDEIRREQLATGARLGIYGRWARGRFLDFAQVVENINLNIPFVVRYRAQYPDPRRILIDDLIRGKLELPAISNDMILLKTNGLPTYHLAHPVDDSLMQVNLVVRGAKLLDLTPLHLDIYEAIGQLPPKYAHIPYISRIDGRARRKVSKSKDPDMAITNIFAKGYPLEALLEYLLTLANPGFEDWRQKNPKLSYINYPLKLSSIPSTDIVFDTNKFRSVSRKYIADLHLDKTYSLLLQWVNEHQPKIKEILTNDTQYVKNILQLASTRKDMVTWEDFLSLYGFFFDEIYESQVTFGYTKIPGLSPQELLSSLNHLMTLIASVEVESKEKWIQLIYNYAEVQSSLVGLNIASRTDETKAFFQKVLSLLRLALTTRLQCPDIYTTITIMGSRRSMHRLQLTANFFKLDQTNN